MPEERAPYTQREAKLIFEWINKFHPKALQWRREQLGPVITHDEARLMKMLRRWCDAIFFEDDTVYIVEAAWAPDPGKVSQLELYKQLFPKTPKFVEWKDKPVKLIFLTTKLDVEVRDLCKERDIEYVVWLPDWGKEEWKKMIERGY